MLSVGKSSGMAKNSFSIGFNLKSKVRICAVQFLPNIYPTISKKIRAALSEIMRGVVDKGAEYPKLSDRLFSSSPKNIRKEMLSPHESMSFSRKLNLFNLNILRINAPGKRERRRNPKICLKNEIFI
jgi:hypothetical protein